MLHVSLPMPVLFPIWGAGHYSIPLDRCGKINFHPTAKTCELICSFLFIRGNFLHMQIINNCSPTLLQWGCFGALVGQKTCPVCMFKALLWLTLMQQCGRDIWSAKSEVRHPAREWAVVAGWRIGKRTIFFGKKSLVEFNYKFKKHLKFVVDRIPPKGSVVRWSPGREQALRVKMAENSRTWSKMKFWAI